MFYFVTDIESKNILLYNFTGILVIVLVHTCRLFFHISTVKYICFKCPLGWNFYSSNDYGSYFLNVTLVYTIGVGTGGRERGAATPQP